MKLHADPRTHLNTITGYGPGFIEVNAQQHASHIIVIPDAPVQPWSIARFNALSAQDLQALCAFQPELVLLGTGWRQRPMDPALVAALAPSGVGLEMMNTPAACRTYNILMAEGRKVLAALLIED